MFSSICFFILNSSYGVKGQIVTASSKQHRIACFTFFSFKDIITTMAYVAASETEFSCMQGTEVYSHFKVPRTDPIVHLCFAVVVVG